MQTTKMLTWSSLDDEKKKEVEKEEDEEEGNGRGKSSSFMLLCDDTVGIIVA